MRQRCIRGKHMLIHISKVTYIDQVDVITLQSSLLPTSLLYPTEQRRIRSLIPSLFSSPFSYVSSCCFFSMGSTLIYRLVSRVSDESRSKIYGIDPIMQHILKVLL